MHGSADARALHAAHPAIDLHADTLMWTRWLGYDLARRHEAPLPGGAFFGHVDVPRLAEGGIGAQFFGLVSLPVAHRGNGRVIDEQIDLLDAGFPAYGRGRRDDEGLSRWGQELVRRCEAESVIVDLAHINRAGFLDVCRMAERPPIVSHTGVSQAYAHWRNIDDEQLRAIADNGGVVGIIFCPRFLGGTGIDDVVRHVRHVIDAAGEDTPALGSDWDGFIRPNPDLR